MTNYLELGATVLHSRMLQYAGVSVVYRRGDQQITIAAVPGRVVTGQDQGDGVFYREIVRDFVVKRSSLSELDPPTPVRNDQIIQTIDGDTWVFTVNGDSGVNSHYEEADSYGVAWRIHTKRDSHA